jgi:hypothetical protein
MSSEEAPGVFLAHATADNDRFARALALGLNGRGLHVWFDEWEMDLGDSVVDRIFEEGVPSAEAMVVVVSEASVKSRWVREEMNAGFIRRIEGRFKLIPIIIDDVPIPGALRSALYRRVSDLADIDPVIDAIVRAVLGDRNRPEPGQLPAYAKSIALPGFDRVDARVLQAAGDLAVETNQRMLESKDVLDRVAPDGISEEAFLESLEILENKGYVEVHATMAADIRGKSAFSFTIVGLEEYAGAFLQEYSALQQHIIQSLANSQRNAPLDIDTTRLLNEHVLDILASNGLIRITKVTGPMTSVDHVSPELRRMLN